MFAIVSVCKDWGIGYRGKLLVKNPADMKRFVELTMGGCVIMGRKTFESFPAGALKGRRNIVLTRSKDFSAEDVECVRSKAELLQLVKDEPKDRLWLIGGQEVYRLLLSECERVYVTMHDCVRTTDAYFPNLDEDPAWRIEQSQAGGVTEDGIAFSYISYVRA